mmetsp:Transcript_18032/g.43426  ORF Transcript_18032/g.43426 Transcript_18032/m.43426 type:complete len:203 (-) Transcript_18032:690-1298(-)
MGPHRLVADATTCGEESGQCRLGLLPAVELDETEASADAGVFVPDEPEVLDGSERHKGSLDVIVCRVRIEALDNQRQCWFLCEWVRRSVGYVDAVGHLRLPTLLALGPLREVDVVALRTDPVHLLLAVFARPSLVPPLPLPVAAPPLTRILSREINGAIDALTQLKHTKRRLEEGTSVFYSSEFDEPESPRLARALLAGDAH